MSSSWVVCFVSVVFVLSIDYNGFFQHYAYVNGNGSSTSLRVFGKCYSFFRSGEQKQSNLTSGDLASKSTTFTNNSDIIGIV